MQASGPCKPPLVHALLPNGPGIAKKDVSHGAHYRQQLCIHSCRSCLKTELDLANDTEDPGSREWGAELNYHKSKIKTMGPEYRPLTWSHYIPAISNLRIRAQTSKLTQARTNQAKGPTAHISGFRLL